MNIKQARGTTSRACFVLEPPSLDAVRAEMRVRDRGVMRAVWDGRCSRRIGVRVKRLMSVSYNRNRFKEMSPCLGVCVLLIGMKATSKHPNTHKNVAKAA